MKDRTASFEGFARRQSHAALLRVLRLGAPRREVIIRPKECGHRAEGGRRRSAHIAKTQPHNSRLRADLGERAAIVARRDPDRGAGARAPRIDLNVACQHRADAERIDRAHGVDGAIVQRDAMTGGAIGERIGAENAIAVL